jgi:hypothetical protein
MKKQVIYTNKDNDDFVIENHTENPPVLKFGICNGGSMLYFLDFEEVQEFCEILTSEALKTFKIKQ